MCGRFTLSSSGDALVDTFGLAAAPVITPRYNIAPSQSVLTVTADDHAQHRATSMRWGLVPGWAKDLSIGNKLINARAETAADKPAFRGAFRHRRCLVPADGFFEWQASADGKQPFHFRRRDGAPFGIAGLWERWEDPDGKLVLSCTLLTTAANAVVAPVHPRMPVILRPRDYGVWLDSAIDRPQVLQKLLCPYREQDMTAYPVSKAVNRPTHDLPECIEPLRLVGGPAKPLGDLVGFDA